MIKATIETLMKVKEYRIVEIILVSGKTFYEVQTREYTHGIYYWKKVFRGDCLAEARSSKANLEGIEVLSERVIE